MFYRPSSRLPTILTVVAAALQNVIPANAAAPIDIARDAAVILQESWYNGNTGLYNTTGWWNSANAITMLADMTAIDPNILDRTSEAIFNNTFNRAQQSNLGVLKLNATFECDGINDDCEEQIPAVYGGTKGWLNAYFDDEGWWALAWISVWDLTQDDVYLDAATDIFNDMVSNGLNASCDGMWWNKAHTAVNSIANELFISVASHLANRKPNGDYYLTWAKKQWTWFLNSGLINADGNIVDGLNRETCKTGNSPIWSYNQGVILGALVELNRADPTDGTYIPKAVAIANAALANPKLVSNTTGILHDLGEPDEGASGFTFKGVFVRNLGILNAHVRSDAFEKFIRTQAESIVTKNKNADGQFGPVWDKLNDQFTNAATHVSAMDALVAASSLQPGEGGYIGAFQAAAS